MKFLKIIPVLVILTLSSCISKKSKDLTAIANEINRIGPHFTNLEDLHVQSLSCKGELMNTDFVKKVSHVPFQMDIITGGDGAPICQIHYDKEKLNGIWGESFGYSEMNILGGICQTLAVYYFKNPFTLVDPSGIEMTDELIESNTAGTIINFDRQNRYIDYKHLNASVRINYKAFERFNLPSEIISTIENNKDLFITKSLISFRDQSNIPVPLEITGGTQEGTKAFKMLDMKFKFLTCQFLK